jgi:hypothetical protein
VEIARNGQIDQTANVTANGAVERIVPESVVVVVARDRAVHEASLHPELYLVRLRIGKSEGQERAGTKDQLFHFCSVLSYISKLNAAEMRQF